MKKIVNNILKDYKEIKYLNERKIEQLNNENELIDLFFRDIKSIVNSYDNKIKDLEEDLMLTKFSYNNCLKALSETDESLKEYLESQGKL